MSGLGALPKLYKSMVVVPFVSYDGATMTK